MNTFLKILRTFLKMLASAALATGVMAIGGFVTLSLSAKGVDLAAFNLFLAMTIPVALPIIIPCCALWALLFVWHKQNSRKSAYLTAISSAVLYSLFMWGLFVAEGLHWWLNLMLFLWVVMGAVLSAFIFWRSFLKPKRVWFDW